MTDSARSGEQGGSRLKFLIVVAIIAAVACAGYFYVPVAYHAYLYKDLMQTKVDAAAALAYPTTWVTDQLTKSGPEYEVPSEAIITPAQEDDRMQVRVQYSKPIEFPGYTYVYEFDHTARSTQFLGKTK
ncbi:MAG: hypothetical protein H0V18_09250 [Pyrinomonadaceae bacterium]|jgi:flagellar basal body-associated protein FliL|nr:hypothetical protein [Pyrinomonadaceae bacterium]